MKSEHPDDLYDPDDDTSETVLTLERTVTDADRAVDDDVDVDVDVDETDTEAGQPAVGRGFARWLRLAVIGLIAVAATAALAALSVGEYRQRQAETLSTEAVDTSRDYLVAMAAFDYQNIDANRERIIANSTPEFAGKYDEMVKALRDIVVASEGVATATAEHVVAERVDDDAATVVAFVDQHVTNVTAPEGSNQKYRMVVTLVRSGDRWIVNDVATV